MQQLASSSPAILTGPRIAQATVPVSGAAMLPLAPAATANAQVDAVFDAAKHGAKRGVKWGAIGGLVAGSAIGVVLAFVGGPGGIVAGGATAGLVALKYGLMLGAGGAALGADIALLR